MSLASALRWVAVASSSRASAQPVVSADTWRNVSAAIDTSMRTARFPAVNSRARMVCSGLLKPARSTELPSLSPLPPESEGTGRLRTSRTRSSRPSADGAASRSACSRRRTGRVCGYRLGRDAPALGAGERRAQQHHWPPKARMRGASMKLQRAEVIFSLAISRNAPGPSSLPPPLHDVKQERFRRAGRRPENEQFCGLARSS